MERLDIICVEIDRHNSEALPNLRRQQGLIVAAKAPTVHSQLIDQRENDVINAINDQTVTDLALFRKTINDLKSGSRVPLQIERNHPLQYVVFHIQ